MRNSNNSVKPILYATPPIAAVTIPRFLSILQPFRQAFPPSCLPAFPLLHHEGRAASSFSALEIRRQDGSSILDLQVPLGLTAVASSCLSNCNLTCGQGFAVCVNVGLQRFSQQRQPFVQSAHLHQNVPLPLKAGVHDALS